jgi:opine dehydrogenase
MSAARIEKMNGDFWMYRESFSPAVWNLVEQLDEEKNSVLKAFGCERLDYLDACKFRNENDLSVDALKVFQAYAANGGPKGPQTLKTRFMYEDIPNGLCLLSSLANHIGIETPVCNALITIGCSLMKTDYWKVARTPERLGLSEMSKKQIIDYIS